MARLKCVQFLLKRFEAAGWIILTGQAIPRFGIIYCQHRGQALFYRGAKYKKHGRIKRKCTFEIEICHA